MGGLSALAEAYNKGGQAAHGTWCCGEQPVAHGDLLELF